MWTPPPKRAWQESGMPAQVSTPKKWRSIRTSRGLGAGPGRWFRCRAWRRASGWPPWRTCCRSPCRSRRCLVPGRCHTWPRRSLWGPCPRPVVAAQSPLPAPTSNEDACRLHECADLWAPLRATMLGWESILTMDIAIHVKNYFMLELSAQRK